MNYKEHDYQEVTDKLRENLKQKNWDNLPFREEEFEDLPSKCDCCNKPIDVFEGYYVVAEWKHACSEECTCKLLGKELFNEGKTEWEKNGDSDIWYWTDWS